MNIDLSKRMDIDAPLNSEGERCPWPWCAQELVGKPIGMFHCPYCDEMVLAGALHIDYRGVCHDDLY